jgi:crotonobetainyl-CoA:carnitine CoA-transferase CaiB-like acyl-CoA transferase
MLAGGSPRYGLYETADGKCLAVGAIEQKFWEAFCTGVELPRELWDERKDPAATRAEVARRVRSRDAAAWHRILASLDCCATVLVPLEEAVQDPHFVGRDLLAYAAQANRRPLPLTALPIARAFRTPPEIPRQVPDSGEHTRAVLDPDYEG